MLRTLGMWLVPLTALTVVSCTSNKTGTTAAATKTLAPDAAICATPTDTQPVEWVGFHTEIAMTPDQINKLVTGLVGAGAQGGNLLKNQTLSDGFFVNADADTTTPDQARLTFSYNDGGTTPRTLAVAPASFSIGSIFEQTVQAALAQMAGDEAKQPQSSEQFLLEYRVTSTQGGRLSFGVHGNLGQYSIVVDIGSPKTSLLPSKIGQAAEDTAPYDTVAGTVWFTMTKDDFDFFVDHAYGKGATGAQNFKDFALVPHEWLRLTVTPHLEQKFVNVSFEVLTLDGKRLAVANAPASILAGNVFQTLVSQNMARMNAQEAAKAGSSIPWQAPFYYDAPQSGGVVQVIAQGLAGKFTVAYAIESPHHTLKDVDFLEYRPVDISIPDASVTASCDKLGDPTIQLAAQGTLNISFTASDVVKNSTDLKVPLVGTLYCSVYHASDVTITGPNDGAKSVQDFQVADADLGSSTPPTFTTNLLMDGDYQVLCAQDLDKSGGPSKGDPVTLPIGAVTVGCNKNPVTVQFALLDPG